MKQRLTLLRAGASALALLAGGPVAASTFDFAFTGAIETGTITQAGTYEVSLGGALGGDSNYLSYFGGYGARVSGTVFLSAGTAFSVLVGGYGRDGYYSGGGGGMSWLDIDNDGTIEAVAGGGGGAGAYGYGGDGRAVPVGGNGDGLNNGGTGGFGGQAGTGDSGSGGAGIFGPGASSYYPGSASTGGYSAPTWAGGQGGFYGGDGRFGGGGGGNVYGGGGGGGYSGGGGGDGLYYGDGGGGGGGSYLAPIFGDRSLVAGGSTSGAYVSLHLVQPIPTPGAFALMGTSALAFAAVARSRRRRG